MAFKNRAGSNRRRRPPFSSSKSSKQSRLAPLHRLGLEWLEFRRMLTTSPIILSEIAPAGSPNVLDSAGVAADWLEITNTSSTQAVNLNGWKLEYGNSSPTIWSFPNMTLGPGEARVIFCDSDSQTDPTQELHTNFNISNKSPKDLELVDNSGNVISSYLPYPASTSGVSYGIGEIVNETDIIPVGATATYLAPTNGSLGTTWTAPGFNDSSWASGPTGLGYSIANGFATTLYKANTGSVANLAQAEAVVSTPSEESSVTSETESALNFMDTGGGGHFGSDNPFPGMTVGEGLSDYVLTANGTITISSTGYYTFGASSDDGFSMTLTGANFFDGQNTTTASGSTMASDKLQGPTDTFATTYLAAGSYSVNLTYYQNAGGAEFELFSEASSSSGVTSFNSNFQLVGNTAAGGLAVTSVPFAGSGSSSTSPIAAAIQTNVKSAVQSAITTAGATSLYVRMDFDASDISSLTSLTLRMQFDSGYVAYLNGVEVASSNAPASPSWNSEALEYRNSPVQSTTFQDVDLSSFLNAETTGALMATGNVLAIQVLMASPTDQSLFVLPEISEISIAQTGLHFFNQPSPGTYNTVSTWEPDLTFSNTSTEQPVQHGFFSAPFQLTLTTTTPGATIYYTTDNSTPSATNGTAYTVPITISATTDVRAVSIIDGNAGVVSTESYIFLADVINQPADPPGFPTGWGDNGSGAEEPANYAMNPAITQNPLYAAGLEQDLLSLPTVSISTDISNLFSSNLSPSANSGIYTNLDNLEQTNGVSLVVPASFEYFNSGGSISLQINMELQMEGGVGRDPQYQSHSFRMEFNGDNGPSALNYPLFPGDSVTSFENIDLKAGFNDTWSWAGSGNPPGDAAQYMRDIFAANSQLAMGQPGFHSQYVLLYIDGLFWGVYMMDERPDADFAAAYLGGSPSQYEANNAGHEVDGSATNLPYWNELMNFPSSNNMGTLAAFEQIQGNNPNGTPNASDTDLLNMDDYVDYMLLNFYVGNTDWPWHNFYAAIDTADPTGFDFFSWDAEMSLGMINGGFNSGLNVNVLGLGTSASPAYSNGNGVASLYLDMVSNPEFDIAFADQVQQMFFNNGALTPAASISRYQSQVNEISEAMILESARWGDIATSPGPLPNTQAAWLNEADWILDTYLPQRTGIVLSQLQAAGLYPDINAPEFLVNGTPEYGGTFTPGSQLTMTASGLPTGAVIYYTLDGSDPRLVGGAVSTASDVFTYTGPITLTQGEEVRARVYSNGTWSAISEAEFTVNLSAIRVTELMYDPLPATQAETNAGYTSVDGKEDFEFLEIQNTGTQTLPLQGLQITGGVAFTFPNVSIAAGGFMVVVSDEAAFDTRYGQELQSEFGTNWQSLIVAGQYTHHLGNSGDTVELTAPNGGVIQDFTYDGTWYAQTQGGGFSLQVRSSSQSLSLWSSASGWVPSGELNGTPGTAELLSIPLPGAIVINEVLANPILAGGDMIELHNTTSQPVNVGGWWLSDSSSNLTMYQIAANTIIAPYGYLVETDAHNYGPGSGDPGADTPFVLSPYGFDIFLSSNDNGVAGGYQENQSYDATPLGISAGLLANSTGGTDFVLLSSPTFGSGPNYTGATNVATAYVSPIVINELMYDPSQPTAAETAAGFTDGDDFEFIELYNRSSTPQSLANYYLASGIGFTFGWYADGDPGEYSTLEQGATATWSTNALSAGTYTVYADYSLTDQNGNARKVDSDAQYTILYPGGSQTVTIDQSTAVDGKLDLGSITTTGSGPIQVELTRGTSASPSQWTMADQVEFVSSDVDLKVGNPTVTSFSMQSGLTTLAPGGYVVLVSDYAAFNFRYDIAANDIPVAGVYSGHQNNSGELIALDEAGPANATTGFVPYYQTDLIDYSDAAPWPTQPAGEGPSLIRLRPADYGNDPDNWMASNVGGTPGTANIAFDPIAPTVPTNLLATANANTTAIVLNWTASTDPRSDVDHYMIYRDGAAIGTSQTTSFDDTTVTSATNYTYTVSAVNRDGVESSQSSSIVAALPGITSYDWIDANDIEIYFNEPLTAASAGTLSNYSIGGGIAFTAVALSRDDTKITLTTNTALVAGSSFTITMSNLATASGDILPGTQQISGTFQIPTGTILDQVWDNLDGGDAVSDLTNPALNPNYPNNPTYSTYLTSFEAPNTTGVNDYGQRIQGYIYAPTTGYYTFWIASDDESQLWLSTNSSPNNAVEIAYVSSYTAYRQWTAESTQQSAQIYLVAGQRYYIDALMKQGNGGDNLSVAWQIPGTTFNTSSGGPIPGTYLAPYGGNIDLTAPAAPANLQATITGTNNQITLSWSPVIDLTSGIDHYVIYRDGQVYATTTTTSFTDTQNISSENLYTYQIAAVNWDGVQGAESNAVSLSPLGIASVTTINNTTVAVRFTEPVDPASSQVVANYRIPGLTISAAALQSDGITVLLTTSTMANSSYTLSVSNVDTLEGELMPTLSDAFTNAGPGWAVTVYEGNSNITVSTVETAEQLIETSADWLTAPITASPTVINYATGLTTGVEGDFGSDVPLPGQSSVANNVVNYALTATGQIYIPTAGTYTFDGNTDDGFILTIVGANFVSGTTDTSVGGDSFEYDATRPAGDTLGVANFTAAGYYSISLVMFNDGGPSGVEISAAQGAQTSFSSSPFHLIGDTVDGGLAMGGSYAPAPFNAAVNPLTTNDASPSLSGTTGSASVNLTVRVNGVYYAVANNNGAWTLPAGEIQPTLASGTYDVLVMASNSAGQTAFNTDLDQLTIDTAGPTAQIVSPVPSTVTSPLGSIAIHFSEPVDGFSLQNLQLTFDGRSAPLAGATLTTADNQNWTLGNIAGLTAHDGTYQLTVNAQEWAVTDGSGTDLATSVSTSWTVAAGTLVGNPSGNVYRIVVDSVDPNEADVYINNASMPAYSATIADLSQWTLNGELGDQLTVDFSNGDPLPAGGLTFSGTSGDQLIIVGTTGNDAVTVSPTQIIANGAPAINYSNIADFQFNLGAGQDSLAIDGASVQLNQNNAISSGTALTINDGGLLDLGGMTDTVASTLLASGQINDGTLSSGSYVVQSGTIGASLTGSAGLLMNGSGTVTLSGTNSYTGGTQIDSGTLVAENNALPAGGSVTTAAGSTIELSGADSSMIGTISGAGNAVLDPNSDVTVESIDQNTLSIGAGSVFTIAPSGPGIQTDATAPSATLQTDANSAVASADTSEAIAEIQAAVASGSISSVKGQQLENRIEAIERLAATDPGLDVSELESIVLAALPTPIAPTTNVVASTSTDGQQSTGATPTATIAAPIVNTAATSVAPVSIAPAEPTNMESQTSSPAATLPLLTTTANTSSVVAVLVITTASQLMYPLQPFAIVSAYPVVDHLLEADSLSAPIILAPLAATLNNAAPVSTSGRALSPGRDSLFNQLFQEFGERLSGEDTRFGGPSGASLEDISQGDATAAGPAPTSRSTSPAVFEAFGLDLAGTTSNGSRHASRGGRIVSDLVTSDWSDEFLYAISAFGDSSTDPD